MTRTLTGSDAMVDKDRRGEENEEQEGEAEDKMRENEWKTEEETETEEGVFIGGEEERH